MENVIAIYDSDTVYLKNLAAYFMRKSECPLHLMTFSDPEQLRSYLKTENVRVLITGTDFWKDTHSDFNVKLGMDAISGDRSTKSLWKEAQQHDEREEAGQAEDWKAVEHLAGWKLVLVEEPIKKKQVSEATIQICRYASSAELLHLVIELLEQNKVSDWGEGKYKKTYPAWKMDDSQENGSVNTHVSNGKGSISDTCVIGIYSPVHRCGKTTLAVLLTQLLQRRKSSLMISMDQYNPLFASEEGNLSDYIYGDIRQQNLYNNCQIQKPYLCDPFIQQWQGISYLAAPDSGDDLFQLCAEQILQVINGLLSEKKYGYIIIDFHACKESYAEVLEQCDVILMPYLQDCISSGKLEQFEQRMMLVNGQEKWQTMKKKIHKIILPEPIQSDEVENYYRELLWSDFSRQVESLIQRVIFYQI